MTSERQRQELEDMKPARQEALGRAGGEPSHATWYRCDTQHAEYASFLDNARQANQGTGMFRESVKQDGLESAVKIVNVPPELEKQGGQSACVQQTYQEAEDLPENVLPHSELVAYMRDNGWWPLSPSPPSGRGILSGLGGR